MGFEEDFTGGAGGDTTEPTAANQPTGASTDTSAGKHALLMVPDFAPAAGGAKPMNSYLRLGAFHSDAANKARVDLGEDLAALVHGFTDDLRERDGGTGPDAAPTESFPMFPGTPPGATAPQAGTSLTEDQRRQESMQLHKKGGWRDHSDGNRITTTRGDKVEVIRGNYKLLVLGRTDPPKTSKPGDWNGVTGVEMAGGCVDNNTDMWFGSDPDAGPPNDPDASRDVPLLQTTFKWFTDPSGDGHFGWQQTIQTGSPNLPRGNNGQVISKTWVDLQEIDVGSPDQYVRKVLSNTYGYDIEQNFHALTMTQNVDAQASTQITNANEVKQVANARDSYQNIVQSGGTVNQVLTGAAMNNVTAGGVQATASAILAMLTAKAFGVSAEVDLGLAASVLVQIMPAMVNVQIALAVLNTFMGTFIDNHMGNHMDVHTGIHFDDHAGMHMDLHLGSHVSCDSTNKIDISEGVGMSIALAAGISLDVTQTKVTQANVMQIAAGEIHL